MLQNVLPHHRVVSGIQPSGLMHLGNYYGAVKQWIALQERAQCLYFIADWHALTTIHNGQQLKELTQSTALDILALGLEPSKAILFRQSEVSAHTHLTWVLSSIAPMALLERAHSYKDKVAKGLNASVGLFTYPVLMSADILLYDADFVPVGQDQKQHVEIARDLATKFNCTYLQSFDPKHPYDEQGHFLGLLKPAQPLILEEIATISGLDGQKMSKSYGNTLEIFLEEAKLKKKIMSMATDSTAISAPKPTKQPLYDLLALLAPAADWPAIEQSWLHGGVGYGEYKKQLLGYFLEKFAKARQKRLELQKDLGFVEQILAEGAYKAADLSDALWQKVLKQVGCGKP